MTTAAAATTATTTLTLPQLGTHNFCPKIRCRCSARLKPSSPLAPALPCLPPPASLYAYAIYACRPLGTITEPALCMPVSCIYTHTYRHAHTYGGTHAYRGTSGPKVSRCPRHSLHAYFARILEFQLKINHKNVAYVGRTQTQLQTEQRVRVASVSVCACVCRSACVYVCVFASPLHLHLHLHLASLC